MAKDRFRESPMSWVLLAVLMKLSSALSLVFKTITRSLVVETVGEQIHTRHAEAFSRTSERASTPFPEPLHRGIGRDGMHE